MKNLNQILTHKNLELEHENSMFQSENLYLLPENQNPNQLLRKRSIRSSIEYKLMNNKNLTISTDKGEWTSFSHFF